MAKNCGFSKIHVFPYSERTINTASFMPDKIEEKIIKNRSRQLISLSNELTLAFIKSNIGKEKNVLIEIKEQKNGINSAYGLTDNFIKVYLNNVIVDKGEMVKVKILSTENNYALGKIA